MVIFGSLRKDVCHAEGFPKEFRADVVRVAQQRDSGVTIGQVAADLGVSTSCLQRWLNEENKKSSPGVGQRLLS